MTVHTQRRSVRRQITLPQDVDTRLREIAAQRGQTKSAVIAEAILGFSEPSDQMRRMLVFAGVIKGGGDQPLGRMVDEVVYGPRP